MGIGFRLGERRRTGVVILTSRLILPVRRFFSLYPFL